MLFDYHQVVFFNIDRMVMAHVSVGILSPAEHFPELASEYF
jgi:hypothetical protein